MLVMAAGSKAWSPASYRFCLLDEAGPVRVNESWGKISFRDGGVASQLHTFVVPAPSQRTRRNGAPTVLVMAARSKAWATRPVFSTQTRRVELRSTDSRGRLSLHGSLLLNPDFYSAVFLAAFVGVVGGYR